MFPIVKLTLFEPDPIPNHASSPPPSPVIVDGEQEYFVERILEAKYCWNKLWYKVRWKGYDASEDKWVCYNDLHNADEYLDAFYKAHPGAPRQVICSVFNSIPFRHAPPTHPSPVQVRRGTAL